MAYFGARYESKAENELYDEEARKIFKQLNIDPTKKGGRSSRYNNLDVIYKHPTSGGKVYVGNIGAAGSLEELKAHGIRRVVNCQDKQSKNFHEGVDGFKYFRFPIAYLRFVVNDDTVEKEFKPVWDFIDTNVAAGESVLIHCLAGAHRAGSTGISYLMHVADLNMDKATQIAQRCRPIINPIASLGELLHILDAALAAKREKAGHTKAAAAEESKHEA